MRLIVFDKDDLKGCLDVFLPVPYLLPWDGGIYAVSPCRSRHLKNAVTAGAGGILAMKRNSFRPGLPPVLAASGQKLIVQG